jgi:hypothetical protein
MSDVLDELGMRFQDPPDKQINVSNPTVVAKLEALKDEKVRGRWVLFVTYSHQSTASNLVARIKRMAHFEATHRTVEAEDDADIVEYRVYVRYAKRGK